jgi:hypothetical protein
MYQHNDSQWPEDGSRPSFQNTPYIKYTSDSGQYPMWLQWSDAVNVEDIVFFIRAYIMALFWG